MAQVAPAVRVAVAKEFGYNGENVMGKIVAALRRIGFNYIFDTSTAADLTVMEESKEFADRLANGGKLPLFTSCCPAWIKYAENEYPEILPNISTCRSPMQMFASVINEKFKGEGKKILSVAVMPCTAKKGEAARDEFKDENGKPYSPVYLKTVHNQLSAIFNHAVRYYNLRENPCKKAGSMGKKKNREMMFWTKEQYLKFAEAMMDKPLSYYAFEMLYWCGIREGELLALTPADFDFEAGTVKINKSYQRLHGEDVITTPKTKKSNRTIKMPNFLCDEMRDYLGMLYGVKKKDRIFTVTKSYLHHEMDRGAKEAGVKRIRIHDLRHSHISLLIDMGFSAVAIADRVGHESIEITYRYAHLFPSKQTEMADKLDFERTGA